MLGPEQQQQQSIAQLDGRLTQWGKERQQAPGQGYVAQAGDWRLYTVILSPPTPTPPTLRK